MSSEQKTITITVPFTWEDTGMRRDRAGTFEAFEGDDQDARRGLWVSRNGHELRVLNFDLVTAIARAWPSEPATDLDQRLAEIEAREAAATKGPWFDTRYHEDSDGPHIETTSEDPVAWCSLDVPEHGAKRRLHRARARRRPLPSRRVAQRPRHARRCAGPLSCALCGAKGAVEDESRFTCPRCRAQHTRGYLHGSPGTFRCLRCGYEGPSKDVLPAARRGIYFASKTKHAARWRALREGGVPVISTWIDEAGVGQTSDWQDLWSRCLREASTAAALVMYVEPGEVHKGSLAEVGAALLAGVPVFWVGPEVGTIRRAQGVTICETIKEAVVLAEAAEQGTPCLDGCGPDLRWDTAIDQPVCTKCGAVVEMSVDERDRVRREIGTKGESNPSKNSNGSPLTEEEARALAEHVGIKLWLSAQTDDAGRIETATQEIRRWFAARGIECVHTPSTVGRVQDGAAFFASAFGAGAEAMAGPEGQRFLREMRGGLDQGVADQLGERVAVLGEASEHVAGSGEIAVVQEAEDVERDRVEVGAHAGSIVSGPESRKGNRPDPDPRDGPVHEWFELSYATHLVLPRVTMQSMSVGWQARFVALVREHDQRVTEAGAKIPDSYYVRALDDNGRLTDEDLPHYRHAPLLGDPEWETAERRRINDEDPKHEGKAQQEKGLGWAKRSLWAGTSEAGRALREERLPRMIAESDARMAEKAAERLPKAFEKGRRAARWSGRVSLDPRPRCSTCGGSGTVAINFGRWTEVPCFACWFDIPEPCAVHGLSLPCSRCAVVADAIASGRAVPMVLVPTEGS